MVCAVTGFIPVTSSIPIIETVICNNQFLFFHFTGNFASSGQSKRGLVPVF
jgi:hypothetical protein